jgi:hypothetical protein
MAGYRRNQQTFGTTASPGGKRGCQRPADEQVRGEHERKIGTTRALQRSEENLV